MRVAVLGASGRTGSLVVQLARERGHDVIPVGRHGPALADVDATIANGHDSRAIALAIAAVDALVIAVAPRPADHDPHLMRQVIAACLDAMGKTNVRRLIVVGADGPWRDSGDPITRFILKPILGLAMRSRMADQRAAEEAVRCSATQWTVIRPARLTNGSRTTYRRRRDASNWFGFVTTRAATATSVVDALDDPGTIGAAFAVAS